MSTQKLRELKLYKKLEKDLTYREKLQEKIRQISHPPSVESSNLSKKLNNNKKYFQQQERNAEIQHQNRILFQKIQSQGMKSHYFNKSRSKYRSSKTLDSMQNDQEHMYDRNERNSRKYNNFSQNKIHYQQQQSRISFQQNQQLMRPKPSKPSKKLITQLSPQVLQVFRSRMIQSKVQNQQTILFQGIAQIDSIRFKVKISLKDKTYFLAGKNKHTQIMLKMQLGEYKKFHKEVLMGNPSAIFQFLVIDKGKIRFRTLEEEQQAEYMKRKHIYKIHQQEDDEQNQGQNRKYKSLKKSPKNLPHQARQQQYKFLEQNYGQKSYPSQQDRQIEKQVFETISIPMRHYKSDKSRQRQPGRQKDINKRKENILGNMNKNPKQLTKQSKQKYKTLEEYVNDREDSHFNNNSGKNIRAPQTEVQIRNKKDRYKLPYL